MHLRIDAMRLRYVCTNHDIRHIMIKKEDIYRVPHSIKTFAFCVHNLRHFLIALWSNILTQNAVTDESISKT